MHEAQPATGRGAEPCCQLQGMIGPPERIDRDEDPLKPLAAPAGPQVRDRKV
jgi:hypothetical protein